MVRWTLSYSVNQSISYKSGIDSTNIQIVSFYFKYPLHRTEPAESLNDMRSFLDPRRCRPSPQPPDTFYPAGGVIIHTTYALGYFRYPQYNQEEKRIIFPPVLCEVARVHLDNKCISRYLHIIIRYEPILSHL